MAALKANIESALCDAVQVCKLQRWAEKLKQQVQTLEQELHGLGGHGDSDYEVMKDEEPVGPCLPVRPVVQHKVKHKQPMAQGRHPQGAPNVTEFTTYQPFTQAEGIKLGKQIQQGHGETLATWVL